jgi:ribonuclease III
LSEAGLHLDESVSVPTLDAGAESWLRNLLGATPGNTLLFAAALTHRSASDGNNERLEFLGDAVLGLVVAQALFERFPDADEGTLSRLRSRLVSATPLAKIGAEVGIGAVLRLGSGELKSGGFRRESILADAVEALIGSVYLDSGLTRARELVLKLMATRLAALNDSDELKDAKTRLQELLQGRGQVLPNYLLERAEGEPHEQTFWVRCEVAWLGQRAGTNRDEELVTQGNGSSRRSAEQLAAERMLVELQSKVKS